MNSSKCFEQDYQILSYFLDRKGQLSPYHLLKLMQETAWGHVDANNVGWNYLKQFNQFWALIRVHVIVDRFPKWNEEVVLRTWGKPSDALLHYRDHEMVDREGNVIIRSTSSWVILDFDSGKPQKVSIPSHLYTNGELNAIAEKPPKIKMFDYGTEHSFQPVLYSDIDVNQHVNNSNYLQFVINHFDPQYIASHRLKEFYVNYISQLKLGDSYAVKHIETEPNHFISSVIHPQGEACRIETIWEKE